MSNIIDKIQLSGVTYDIGGGGGTVSTAITSGDTNAVAGGAVYDKFDEVEQVTAQALNVLNESLSGKQDTLSAGTGIDITSNVISVTGSTGGKAIVGGRGISVTTGETADTVSFNLPISAGTGTGSIIEGLSYNIASGEYSHAEGFGTTAIATGAHAEGSSTQAKGPCSHAEGKGTIVINVSEHGCGQYNVSNKKTAFFGNSGNTLFSVGNGTADNVKHNAFEIRQNGDIYIADTNDTSTSNYYEKPMIKLQDHLGGGGSSYTAGDGIDITNNVISVTGKVDTTTYSTYTAATDNRLSEDEEVTAAALNNLNEALSGKQDTLSAGTNITIVDNVISAEGGSITIDPSLDTGSTNAVANSAITTAINAVSGAVPTQYVKKIVRNSDNGVVRYYDVWKESGYAFHIYNFSINGKMVLSKQNGTYPDVYNFNLVETSAITTAVTSSSTDAQVPSAKAVNDKLGGLSLVKLTQAQYDNLQNKDSNTLYVIVN